MTEKPMKYACEHEPAPIIMSGDALSIAAYLEWKDSTGYDGDKTQCFRCWCKCRENDRGKFK